MLKGHVFINQNFGNQIFALFINTFLAGNNGVINGYKNSMGLTTSGSQVTVASGALCIQGRFLEEDSSTTIDAGTNDAYCKLVLTINLDRDNTSSFTQGYYEILTGVSDYPALTQNNIVGTNEGKYQYELARFKTGLSGITNFVDKRTFLDFDSIYQEVRETIQSIEDEGIFLLKAGGTMTGQLVLQALGKFMYGLDVWARNDGVHVIGIGGSKPKFTTSFTSANMTPTTSVEEDYMNHLEVTANEGMNLKFAKDKLKINGTSIQYSLVHNASETGNYILLTWLQNKLALSVDNQLQGYFTLSNTSDERLKKDIKEIDENVIKAIGEVKLKQFRVTRNNPQNKISFGVIAQELISAFEKYGLNYEDYDLIDTIEYEEETKYFIVNYEQFNILRLAYLESKVV
jgi:hypothetical protein